MSRSQESTAAHPWSTARAVLIGLWLAVVAALTLTPQSSAFRGPNVPGLSACLVCGDQGTADALLNLLLLAPLGLLLNDRGWKPLRVAAVALVLSTSIELTQHFIPGRYSDLGDVVWNTMGAWLAALAWSLRTRWLPGNAGDAVGLRNLAVGVTVLVTLAFGWLMVPSWPVEPYWGQWTPNLGFMQQYRGKVLRARLDSMSLPPHRIPASRNPRAALMHDWTIETEVVKGPPPTALAPIVSIYNGKQQEVVMLGAVDEDLVLRYATWARRLRLDDPALWFPAALVGARAGDTLRVGILRRGKSSCLVLDGAEVCPAFTPGRAWALLLPFHPLSARAREGLDMACMLLLLLPVGFWSLDVRRLTIAGAVAALGIALAVVVTGLGMPPWSEIVGGVGGLLVGHALRIVVSRFMVPAAG